MINYDFRILVLMPFLFVRIHGNKMLSSKEVGIVLITTSWGAGGNNSSESVIKYIFISVFPLNKISKSKLTCKKDPFTF